MTASKASSAREPHSSCGVVVRSMHVEVLMENRQKKYDSTVKAFFTERMNEREHACVLLATLDLYIGPTSLDEDSPHKDLTFEKACNELCAWWQDQPHEVWLDMDCDHVSESEPEGWTDEETGEWQEQAWESWMHFDARSIKREVFGVLAEYVS